MAQNSITLFSNDSGAAGGAVDFVTDAFKDISLQASNNVGLSSTVSSNPLNLLFANDDSPRFGAKTLYVKDLVLMEDRAFWINGKPTYRIIWNECFPPMVGYVYGGVQLIKNGSQTYILFRNPEDGFGVEGILSRAAFIVDNSTAATATATVQVDGVTGQTLNFSDLSNDASTFSKMNRYSAFVHAATNEAKNLHDIRIISKEALTLKVSGVVVYYENTGANIEFIPGTTYNNKVKAMTSSGATLAVPSLGSSLGGTVLLYKTSGGAYQASTVAATMIQSAATGTGGGSTIDVTAGHGASFPIGTGVAAFSGTSTYVGAVQNVSTDTLTVQPALGVGVSGLIYKLWSGGQSLPINPTLMPFAFMFGSTEMNSIGMTSMYQDPLGRYRVWGSNIGTTFIDNAYLSAVFATTTAAFIQVEGYFSGASVEWVGMSFAILSGTMTVNGAPVYSHANLGFTGTLNKTVFTEAGPGWNAFRFSPGASLINVGIHRISFFKRGIDIGQTFGQLAYFDVLQNQVNRSVSASFIAPGTFRRYFADELPFRGLSVWYRGETNGAAGGVQYIGVSTVGSLRFGYYGKDFAILGDASKASMLVTIDGVSTSTAFNVIKSVASEGFHTVGMTLLGGTNVIYGVDVFRSYGEMKNIQRFESIPIDYEKEKDLIGEVYLTGGNGHGSTDTTVRLFTQVVRLRGTAIRYSGTAENGSVLTATVDGYYSISYTDATSTPVLYTGLTLNSPLLTTAVDDASLDPFRLDGGRQGTANESLKLQTTLWLFAGEVIRAQTTGNADAVAANQTTFRMTYLGRTRRV